MDETTEPIIAVVGHPIAGNPTQFALETGLKSAGVDCRVLSLDLEPGRIPDAMKGMAAMSFAGSWVTQSCFAAVNEWLKTEYRIEDSADFVVPSLEPIADAFPIWRTFDLKSKLWPGLVSECLREQAFTIKKVILVKAEKEPGDLQSPETKEHLIDQLKADPSLTFKRIEASDIELADRPPSQERLEAVLEDSDEQDGVLVLIDSDGVDNSWSVEFLSAFSESVSKRMAVVDLSENWEPSEIALAEHLRANSPLCFIRSIDVHSKCFSEIVSCLFNRTVASDVFQDAIDEYLAV